MTGFVSRLSPGYIVRVTEPGDKDESQRRLFGTHSIAGAVSPNSRRPLLRLLQLDMVDPRLGFNGSRGDVLPLLFSWSCEMSQAPVIYGVKSGAAIELMVYRRGKAYDDFPYARYPSHERIGYAGRREAVDFKIGCRACAQQSNCARRARPRHVGAPELTTGTTRSQP